MILEIAKKYNQMIVDKKVDQKELNQLLSVLDGTLNKEFIKVLEEKKINEQWTYVLDTLDKKLKNVTSLDIFLNENKVFSKEDNLVKKTDFNYVQDTTNLFKLCPVDVYYNLILLYFSSKKRAEAIASYVHFTKL